MRALLLFLVLGIVGVGEMLFANMAHAEGKNPEGTWQGKIAMQGIELRLVFHITRKGEALMGTMDSPDQGANGIPIDTVTFANGKLKVEIKALQFTYEGTLNDAGTEIAGKMKQGGLELDLPLKHDAKVAELVRPQDPVKPYPYLEEEVSYPNPKAPGVTLAGTLTLPKGEGPFPVALLITGSGAQNRDEELLGHKPFLVLADYLTRRGIAVLRVDDRGTAKSTGTFATATTRDFVTDVQAGIAFLKSHKKINPKKIGLIGHSEGGLIAPIVAAETPEVAYIVLMAGPGVSGEEILYEQGAAILRASGAPETAIAAQTANQKKIFTIVKSEQDPAVAEKQLTEIVKAEFAKLPEAQQKAAGGETAALAQVKAVNSPWFRYFLTYDPKPTIMRVKCPVLAINGEKDVQVVPKQNLPVIEAALKAGGNRDFTIKQLPSMNHLFQTCKTGAPGEYAQITETLSPIALQTMGDWIVSHTAKTK